MIDNDDDNNKKQVEQVEQLDATNKKIPVFEVSREIREHWLQHKADWFFMVLFPFFVLMLSYVFSFLATPEVNESFPGGGVFQKPLIVTLLMLTGLILSLYASTIIYIRVSRFILLGENGRNSKLSSWSFRYWRLIKYSILIMVVSAAMVFVASFSLGFLPELSLSVDSVKEDQMFMYIVIPIVIILVCIPIYIGIRLFLFIPAIAMDAKDPFALSWRVMKGNCLRMVGLMSLLALISFLVLLVPIIVYSILLVLVGNVAEAAQFSLSLFLLKWATIIIFQAFFTVVSVSVSTYIVAYVFKHRAGNNYRVIERYARKSK